MVKMWKLKEKIQIAKTWPGKLSLRVFLLSMLATLGTYLVYKMGYALYFYLVVWSPSHLAPYPVRTCHGCDNSTIPKLLHQTWKTTEVPERWQRTYKSCLEKHHEYKHVFWTDKMVEEFLAKEYPWFLPTYYSYPYAIQRVDSSRYFILYHYGGVYLDLDVGCHFSTDQILRNTMNYTVLLAEAVPTGVTNWFMATTPRHPLFRIAIDTLQSTNNWYFTPHITIMWSAGPMHLTHSVSSHLHKEQVLILPLDKLLTYYFWRVPGGSWHRWDEAAFKVLFKIATRLDLVLYGVAFLLTTVVIALIVYCRHKRVVVCDRDSRNKYNI